MLNRPLTSSKLKELLQDRFTPTVEADAVRLSRRIGFQGKIIVQRLLRLPFLPTFQDKE